MRSLSIVVMAAALLAGTTPALAAPCKDAKTGKFVKCASAPAKAARCKNAKGQFAKCGSPGAKPV
ncbi:hypothetical protein K7957_15155 [Sphingomonas yunnanensis]|uniref:hypothetical protein n=1 Tax=Sphingomonas yunnanensis TaxID=310400 RepID=UPI001CA67DCA|nr:hypothetical protein [Sphingomonas yunnanensis]MBY9064276.1 hypothetical protein [Sphingomonas yunnanensis]